MQADHNDSPPATTAAAAAAPQTQIEAAKPHSNINMPFKISGEVLEASTDNFSTNNLIGPTQFGKVYRGKFHEHGKEARSVTIKTVDIPYSYSCLHNAEELLNDELKFLTLESTPIHPNIAKVIGYCDEKGMKGFVYDLTPMDTLHNMMTKENFGWTQRIKVAYSLACLLKTLHSKENSFYVHNVDTSHIMLDQDYNPFMFDFSLMSGGVLGEMSKVKENTGMSEYYCDISACRFWPWGRYCDVFAYGVIILIELITKRITVGNYIKEGAEPTYVWASELAKAGKLPDVHETLQAEPGFLGAEAEFLAKLGMRCIESDPNRRPVMRRIVSYLEHLSLVKELIKE